MPSQKLRKGRIGAAAGIATPVLAFACIMSAIAIYPSFSWANNALSDLGIVPGVTGPLFNFGLYASGFLGLVFAVLGLSEYVGRGLVGKIGASTFAAATVALIAIGVFNESYSRVHYAVSVGFFVLAPISLFIITCAFALSHQKSSAIFTVATGIVAALPWLLLFGFSYAPNVAVPEAISGLAVSAWTIGVSYKILKQTRP